MTVEVDLNEYLEMKRKLGYAEGAIHGALLNLRSGNFSVAHTLVALRQALVVLNPEEDDA